MTRYMYQVNYYGKELKESFFFTTADRAAVMMFNMLDPAHSGWTSPAIIAAHLRGLDTHTKPRTVFGEVIVTIRDLDPDPSTEGSEELV